MPELSLLVINYRSAALTAAAIESARRAASQELQVVVVDNSEDPAEAEALRAAGADEIVVSPRNLGYGAAVNMGRRHCRGRVMVVSNPDVVFEERSLDLLVASVLDGAAVAGPGFVWDDAGQWHLPPAESPDLVSKTGEVLSSRWRAMATRRDRQRLRRRIAFWSDGRSRPVRALSGAVLCLSLRTFDALGGFDERFFLYFEETDLVRRARRSGRAEYVPAAVCRHLFSQSAGLSAESFGHWQESELRFFRKWYGRRGTALMKLARSEQPTAASPVRTGGEWSIRLPSEELGRYLVEASPLPDFVSAAGNFPVARTVSIPAEIVATYKAGALFVRVIDRRTLRPVDIVRFDKNG